MAPVQPNRNHRQLRTKKRQLRRVKFYKDNTLTSYPIQNGHVWFRKGSKEVIKSVSDQQLEKIRMMGI